MKPKTHRPAGWKPARSSNERSRGTARQRGYGTAWQKLRKAFLEAHPLCFYCDVMNAINPAACQIRAAVCCDHYDPVEPTDPKFLDPENLRAACEACNRQKCAMPGDEYVKRITEEARRRVV
jgi:5-methylcytosine-specific restriction endonuclease McrA